MHFRSWLGSYSTAIEDADRSHVRMRYFGELLDGHTNWRIEPRNDNTCDLCYDAELTPLTYAGQTAAALSSKEYLGSYFDPLIDSLKAELDRNYSAQRQPIGEERVADK